jgi:hypothetical protein
VKNGYQFEGLAETIVTNPQFLNKRGRDDPREWRVRRIETEVAERAFAMPRRCDAWERIDACPLSAFSKRRHKV